ncbi:SET domain containing protein [Trichuris trichiura]|uniref:SET domain containing protein n=1 Tax=Trichuris trichiura TaxID=36087 RepID=A0A077ZAX6_TRITR|nr:SET domain containing protein [Trichuris trichiura]
MSSIGPSKETPCFCTESSRGFCEKYCCCSANCIIRFPGCRCHTSCDSKCYTHPRAITNGTLMGNTKDLYIGDSDVHGIGVFAAEDLEVGDFICEYAGEIITQAEADRRGFMYDYTGKSYLFCIYIFSYLTPFANFDIDATRFGNEARFINHSSKPNCEPHVKLVYGSHRIGIYATTSIKKNSELFFNYRPTSSENVRK